MIDTSDILFEEYPGEAGNLGMITLSRPKALNSLSHQMIHAIHAQLQGWEKDDSIKAVIIKAVEGRAFCAGGDIRLTYDRYHRQDPALTHYFRDEYQLNRFIFHFPKPYIALLDGITMGGGVGVSLHGSHRVATDNLLFAMPETGIGFFPDVGGTYFLPRLVNKFGYYLGLTGARIGCDDAVELGLAHLKVDSVSLGDIIQAIANQPFGDDANLAVTRVLEGYQLPVQSELFNHMEAIESCFSEVTLESIQQALHHSQDDLCKAAADMLAKKSPTSLKVTLRALNEGASYDFDTCMKHEYRLVTHFLAEHDFIEGIRAVIIDKDQRPVWQPPTLHEVTREMVDAYFEPLTEELV